MNFGCSGFPQNLHDPVTRCSTNDRIIDHDHTLSCYCFLQRIQLNRYARFTIALFWFDKCSSDISILYKCRSVWNSRFHRISHCCCIPGFRNSHDKICFHRTVFCKISSSCDSCIVYADIINITVCSRKINPFKNASSALFFRDTKAFVGFNTTTRGDRYKFTRFYIADKFRSDRIKCTSFRCKNIGIIAFSDA